MKEVQSQSRSTKSLTKTFEISALSELDDLTPITDLIKANSQVGTKITLQIMYDEVDGKPTQRP